MRCFLQGYNILPTKGHHGSLQVASESEDFSIIQRHTQFPRRLWVPHLWTHRLFGFPVVRQRLPLEKRLMLASGNLDDMNPASPSTYYAIIIPRVLAYKVLQHFYHHPYLVFWAPIIGTAPGQFQELVLQAAGKPSQMAGWHLLAVCRDFIAHRSMQSLYTKAWKKSEHGSKYHVHNRCIYIYIDMYICIYMHIQTYTCSYTYIRLYIHI